MIDSNNILLITEDRACEDLIKQKLVLLRSNDKISVCGYDFVHSTISRNMFYVVLLHEVADDLDTTFKMIETIKNANADIPIILLLNNLSSEIVLSAYDFGVTDFFQLSSPIYELLIKTLNCYKLMLLKKKNEKDNKILVKMGVYSEVNNFLRRNHLQKCFSEISADKRVQNGYFIILTTDGLKDDFNKVENLAKSINCSIRFDDIVAYSHTGRFYLILPNITLDGVKSVVNKIQNDFEFENKIYSGISKVGQLSFDSLEAKSLDALNLSIKRGENYSCFNSDKDGVSSTGHSYKFLENIYNKKLERVIKPVFRHYRNEFEAILPDVDILQYVNDLECHFSLKSDIVTSELILKNINCSKFSLDIVHSGLNTPEKTQEILTLSDLKEETLSHLLIKLKDDFINSTDKMV